MAAALGGVDGRRPNNDAKPGPQPNAMESNNIDDRREDDFYYGCMEEFGLPLDELEALLSGHTPGVKGNIRGMVLLEAFASPNPAKSLGESLSLCKGISCSNRIIDYISSYCNISKPAANSLVRNSILLNAKSKGDSNMEQRAPR